MGTREGVWIPLYSFQNLNEHPFDPWSFTHIQHGMLLFYTGQLLKLNVLNGFALMFILEIMWEVGENTELVVKKYQSLGHSYEGDSYQNFLGDVISCVAGYVLP